MRAPERVSRAPLAWLDSAEALEAWCATPEATPFQHPQWLAHWWRSFAPGHDCTAHVWCASSAAAGTGARGYAAWSVHARRIRALGPTVRRVHPLGQSTWIEDAFPGEYADGGCSLPPDLHTQALDGLLATPWDDLHVAYVADGSALDRGLRAWAARHGFECRTRPAAPSFVVPTAGAFDAYRERLPPGERRAAYAKRRIASRLGIRYVPRIPGPRALATLFDLHDRRWVEGGMPPRVREFLRALWAAEPPGLRLRISALEGAGDLVSALLLLESRGTTYFLQSGFVPDLDTRLSLGKLHLGYEIERAFADADTRAFDLLAGHGQREDYKRRLGAEPRALNEHRIVRSRWLRVLMRGRRGWQHLRSTV